MNKKKYFGKIKNTQGCVTRRRKFQERTCTYVTHVRSPSRFQKSVSIWQSPGPFLLLPFSFSIPVIIYPLITYAVHLLLQDSKYSPNIVQRYLGTLNLLSFIDLLLKHAPKIIPAVSSVCASHWTVGRERVGVWW